MEDQSSRRSSGARRAKAIGAGVAIAALGAFTAFIAAGCGSDSNNTVSSVNNAIDSIQSQASSVQSQISSVSTQVQSQATSVKSQVESVQSQIQTATQSKNGGSSAGGSGYGY
jgi:predicted PurR-regulated permease PerM